MKFLFVKPTLFLFLILLTLPATTKAQSGTIRGNVTDALTDEGLIGANIILLHTQPLIGTATNQDGDFEMEDVPLGRYDIKVTFLGYDSIVLHEVLVQSAKETILDIKMTEQVFEGQEVIVTPEINKSNPINEMAYASSRSFTVEETRRYAGGVDDPSRMVSAFAGVSSGGGTQQNALIVRGNAPKNVQWRLFGVEIPNPNHFAGLSIAGGGGLTLFSNQLLADSDFLTSAFPAQYGNALAGVFDINFRSGNMNRREHTAQIGINGLEFASEGPFNSSSNSTYLFNYRYSTLALLMPLLPTEGSLQYQDISYKIDFRSKKYGRIKLWGIGGWDGQSQNATFDKSQWEYEFWHRIKYKMNMGVGATGLTHNILIGENSSLETSLAATINYTSWQQQRLNQDVVLEPNLTINNTSGRISFRSVLDKPYSKYHLNRTGVSFQYLLYDLKLQSAPNDSPPLATIIDEQGHSELLQFFTQSRFYISPKVTVHTGVHSQWFALTEEMTLEPRMGVEWIMNNNSKLSFGYGLHSQIEDLRIYFIKTDDEYTNKHLKMTKAHHFVLGYDLKVKENTRLKVEVYNQEQYDVPVIADSSFSMINFTQDWTFNEALINKGKGRNYGLETTYERFFNNGYYYLVTGTIYNSQYKGGDSKWYNTRFDQGYAFNVLGGKEYSWDDGKRVLGLNGKIAYVGGERFSPINFDASSNFEEVRYFNQRAFEKKFPNRLIFDATLTYQINKAKHTSEWALQIKNLLMEKDLSHDYNFKTNHVDVVKEGFILPFINYSFKF
ncbi:TonB-dependent receptor [Balneola vulgaris]|uniref:TonB-dependent receptor n=1 Tax=Balneola vulgaris TaxID=287535 RepID=UPI00036EC41A|nr:TonB-dependent receptor [Balneola vulgaris]